MPFKKGEPRAPGAGRKLGVPNKTTTQMRAIAQSYAPAALKELSRLAQNAENESARVSAIKELLDRGYGKSPQPLDGDGEGGAIKLIQTIERRIVRKDG